MVYNAFITFSLSVSPNYPSVSAHSLDIFIAFTTLQCMLIICTFSSTFSTRLYNPWQQAKIKYSLLNEYKKWSHRKGKPTKQYQQLDDATSRQSIERWKPNPYSLVKSTTLLETCNLGDRAECPAEKPHKRRGWVTKFTQRAHFQSTTIRGEKFLTFC